jgi:hypothetical protein
MPADDFELGRIYDRDEIFERWGGSRYSGIAPCRETPNVLIFSDPFKGEAFGYIDNLRVEDDGGPLVRYTGEGREGPQKMSKGNAAIQNHVKDGRALRLFEAVGTVKHSAKRLHKYLGEYRFDGFHYAEAPDVNKQLRDVIVFELRPVGVTAEPEIDAALIPPGIIYEDLHSKAQVAEATTSSLIDPEANLVESLVRKASEESEVWRREAHLVDRFKAFLEAQQHEVKRCKIRIADPPTTLLSDLFDVTAQVLYEAKGRADRNSIRLAIGQLFDYQRHLDPKPAALAILLPEAPSPDLQALIESVGITLVYEDNGTFIGWPVT